MMPSDKIDPLIQALIKSLEHTKNVTKSLSEEHQILKSEVTEITNMALASTLSYCLSNNAADKYSD